jgi:hypothetical protein
MRAPVDRRGGAGDEFAVVTGVEGDGPGDVLGDGEAAQCRLLGLALPLFLIEGGLMDGSLGHRPVGHDVDGDPAAPQLLGDIAGEGAQGRLRGSERDHASRGRRLNPVPM